MSQFEAVLDLLKKAKQEGLHTCLDTSGFAKTERYEKIMEYVDLFLYDYKLTDPVKHRQYTGVDNEMIKKNIDFLCSRGKKLFLRCPIIPGINNEDEHYAEIARLSRIYDTIEQVNVMAYHDMAKSKAVQIGADYPLSELKTIEKEEKAFIYQRLSELGCLKLYES